MLALVVAMCLANLWVLLLRSGIPYSLEGTVTDIQVRTEKLAGIDDVWIVTVGDRQLHLDYDLARALRKDHEIRKGAWSTSVEIESRPDIHLQPSRDFWGMVPTSIVVVGAMWLLGRRRAATSGSALRPGAR